MELLYYLEVLSFLLNQTEKLQHIVYYMLKYSCIKLMEISDPVIAGFTPLHIALQTHANFCV